MKKGKVVLLCVMLVLLTACLTFSLTMHFAAPQLLANYPTASKVAMVESRLQQYFIDDYDEKQLGDAAAAAMVEATGDRWSTYIPADSFEDYRDQLDNVYTGIGVTIREELKDVGFTIESVREGGPADKAGIRVGDILTHVGDEKVVSLGFEETRNRVRGEVGTSVRLTLLRNDSAYTVDVVRQKVDDISVKSVVLDSGVGYVRISNFDRNAAQQAIDCLEKLVKEGVPGVVIDVRTNPGGLRTELVKLLDYLLPEGVVFRSLDYTGKESIEYSDEAYLDLPLVVLVDRYSYSAAEFFAAALQEYGRATVIGENTCGKGNYQTAIPLPDGSAINLSIGKYFTPSGKSLTDVGVTPDVLIPVPQNEKAAEAYAEHLERAEMILKPEESTNNPS